MNEERNDKGFRKLIVWQRAHQLTLSIYTLTEKFPKSEIYGLHHNCAARLYLSLRISLKDMVMGAKDKQGASWILPKAHSLKLNNVNNG